MEWYHFIIVSLFYIAAGTLDGERDTIIYKVSSSWFSGPFWRERNYLLRRTTNPVLRWLIQKPFSFLIDGWHLLKSFTILLMVFPAWYIFWLLTGELNPFIPTLITYVIIGTAFNYSYHDQIF